MAAYAFAHDWAVPCRLVASTHDRYNTLTCHSIQTESNLLRHTVEPQTIPPENNHFRGAKWSPDGSCLLTNSNDNVLRLFTTPASIYESSVEPGVPTTEAEMTPTWGLFDAGSVYDYAWFPSMNAQDPSTCCFLTSVNDHPVRLWDATTSMVRASYRVIDHRERFIGPNVVTFNLDGTRIYCGYENMIEIFDVQRPGSESLKCATAPTKKSKKGQKGIVSCIDFCPMYSGVYAAGSYGQSIGIYDEANNELCLKLTGIQGGVTQVKFSRDGTVLFATSRQSNKIECWDIRNTANVLYQLDRPGMTSQRISFDMDPSGRVLVTGDTSGRVLFYDISTDKDLDSSNDRLLRSMEAHQDIVSAATFHPIYPAVASISGQRKFLIGESDSDSDSDNDGQKNHMASEKTPKDSVDNSLKVWQVYGQWYQCEVPQEKEEGTTDPTYVANFKETTQVDEVATVSHFIAHTTEPAAESSTESHIAPATEPTASTVSIV